MPSFTFCVLPNPRAAANIKSGWIIERDPVPREEIERTKARRKDAVLNAREAEAKAKTIENAIYDLKAVNPHRVAVEDKRTPLEIIDAIRARDREAAAALTRLQELLVADNPPSPSN